MTPRLHIITIQRGSIDLVKLNYNFEHELLNKHCGLDPNLVQGNVGPERWGLEKDRRISRVQNEEIKRRKDDE